MKNELFAYDGRMVPKDNFRAFVYGENGAQKLAESWVHYEGLLATGLWFEQPEQASKKADKESIAKPGKKDGD